MDPLSLMLGDCDPFTVTTGGHSAAEDDRAWKFLADLARDREIVTPVGAVVDFAEVPAMIAGQASAPAGKSVVTLEDWRRR